MTIAHSGRAEGGFRSEGAPGRLVHGPPLIPPPPARQAAPGARGGPATPTERARRGGMRRRREGGQGREPRAAPHRGSREAAARPPPPHPPCRLASRGGAGPHPPEAEEIGPPSPRRDRDARDGGWSTACPPPQPPAPKGTARNKQTRAQRRRASTTLSGMGATPPMTRTTPVTPALLPAQGRQRDGTRQSNPPPYWPPRPHKRGPRRTDRPPSPPTPPPGTRTPRTRPTGGAQPQAR